MDATGLGLARVRAPGGVLPQAAERLDADPQLREDEVLVDVERLNLDAASFHQLRSSVGADPAALRARVCGIVAARGKLHNPVTGSGGMLIGRVREVGPKSPLGLRPGERIATLVSLTLTPLVITDGLAGWDGDSEQIPATGHAVLFGRSLAVALPEDLPSDLALGILDVCGAPALTARVVRGHPAARVCVFGAAGKSGSLSLAAAAAAGATTRVALVREQSEAAAVAAAGLAEEIHVVDARDPVAVIEALPAAADVTVVCLDVPGAEGAAVLATRDGGTVIFFSMATSFAAAALSAEGVAADVTLLIGNGYVPGHAELALDLVRRDGRLRDLLERRVRARMGR